MTAPAILVITGASGSGKTAVVRALELRALAGVRCYHFDAVGVPSLEEMERNFGGPEQWQALTTQRWLDRFATDPDAAEVYVLEGQMRPSFVRNAAERVGTALVQIVLLDCSPATRRERLAGSRGQTELANSQMDSWAAYLRGQADALNMPVIDTTGLTIDAATDALVVHVEAMLNPDARSRTAASASSGGRLSEAPRSPLAA